MANQTENNDELFELNRDLNGASITNSATFDLENQLSKYRDIQAPDHLSNLILSKINQKKFNYFPPFILIAAAVLFAVLGYQGFFNPTNQKAHEPNSNIAKLTAPKDQDVAKILEKELGINEPKTQKYYALYFSSSICRPCIDLLNELDQFYLDQKAINPNFEIVFIELDKHVHFTNNQANLHFKKLEFNEIRDKTFFKQYKDKYGPSFVVLDEKGNVVAKHKKNTHQNSFNTVLTEFSNLLAKS